MSWNAASPAETPSCLFLKFTGSARHFFRRPFHLKTPGRLLSHLISWPLCLPVGWGRWLLPPVFPRGHRSLLHSLQLRPLLEGCRPRGEALSALLRLLRFRFSRRSRLPNLPLAPHQRRSPSVLSLLPRWFLPLSRSQNQVPHPSHPLKVIPSQRVRSRLRVTHRIQHRQQPTRSLTEDLCLPRPHTPTLLRARSPLPDLPSVSPQARQRAIPFTRPKR